MKSANEFSSISAGLGAFVAGFGASEMPATIRHEAKRSILNYFGTALGGRCDPAGEAALRVIEPIAGKPEATVIGFDKRLDILNAAFMNALNANVLEFDDTHMPTIIHPTAPVAAPIFALAERTCISGTALLDAFVLGVEISCRAGNSVWPGHYTRGWHITTTCGVLGAAAACAKLLGLDATEIAHAIGIAATQSSGLVENLPNSAKNVQVGNAARNGLFSALLAQEGYKAASQAIEGPRGWAKAMGDIPDRDALLAGLGQSWELTKNAYKAYPCGIVLAPVIDACLELREKGVSANEIEHVTVRGHSLLLERTDRPVVPDDRIAKLSIQHGAAIAFLFGVAGVKEFNNIDDQAIVALRKKVSAEADDSIPIEAAIVIVRTKDGKTVQTHIKNARGSLAKPLTDREIEAKVRDLASLGGSRADVSALIDLVWSLDKTDDAGRLMRKTT